MITSKKGQEMIKNISPIYANSKIEQAIYEAIGLEFDNADYLAEEILKQIFPQTATWGLVFWENRLNISINSNEDIEKRRQKIITKMQTKWPLTPERMASILKNYTNAEVKIIEGIDDFTFQVLLKTYSGIGEVLKEIINKIKEIKPSHMSFIISINYFTDILTKLIFKSWDSDVIPVCGTIDCSYNEYISTDGERVSSGVYGSILSAFSEIFGVASEETVILGSGKRISESIELVINEFNSEEFIKAADDLFLNNCDGKSISNKIIKEIENLFSEEITKASQENYVGEVK